MDDIYGDLENYNDVNAIDELRNDNKQLKIKVEEHEAEIARLQKRINHLETEHTRVNTNFSSLLKTAKAEVTRKTELINQLNKEKDAMVLKSLKNNDKNLLCIRRNLLRNNHINHANNSNLTKESDTRKSDVDRDRIKEGKRFPSEDSISTSGGTDVPSNHPADDKGDSFHVKLESKENRAQGIRNRRKSMPVSHPITYSSDEGNDSGKEYKTDVSREEKQRRIERDSKHKLSDTSGVDVKYSSHRDSSWEYDYKSRRHSDREMRDGYRSHRTNKLDPRIRRESPGRRRPKKYPERLDDRYRVLDTPPPVEKHHEHRRVRERQTNHNRPYDRSRSRHDMRPPKHRLSHEEAPVLKRIRTRSSNRQMEEPIPTPRTEANLLIEEKNPKQLKTNCNKETVQPIPKPRTEDLIKPSNKHDQHKNETSKQALTDSSNRQSNNRNSEQSRTDFVHRPTDQLNKNDMSKQAYGQIEKVCDDKRKVTENEIVNFNWREDSCMSPEYNLVEVSKNVPREIKLLSSCKLDDPRLKSSKYILKTDSQKETLSTVIGRNVDIKNIDKSTWDIPKVPLPEALRKPPESYPIVHDDKSKLKENLVKHIYMDIDNPVSNLSVNLSMESGEILSDTNDTPYARAVAASFFADYDNVSNQAKSDRFTHTKTDSQINFDSKPQSFPEKIGSNDVMESQNCMSENVSRKDDDTRNIKKTGSSISDAILNKRIETYKIPKKSDRTAKYHKDMKQAPPKEKITSPTEKHNPTTCMNVTNIDKSTGKINCKDQNISKEGKSNQDIESRNSSSNSSSSALQLSNESFETSISKPKKVLKLSELKGYRKLSPREIVAADLELSSDTNDFSFKAFSRKEPISEKKHDEKSNTNTKGPQSETVKQVDKVTYPDKNDKFKSKHNNKHTKTKDSNSSCSTKYEKKSTDKIADTKNDYQSVISLTNNKTVPSSDKKTKLKDLFGDNLSLKDAEETQKTSHKGASTEVVIDKHTIVSPKSSKTHKVKAQTSAEKLKYVELLSDNQSSRLKDEETQKTSHIGASSEVIIDKHTKVNAKSFKTDKTVELFGDSLSGSLLTPEDLGLNVRTAASCDNYVPVFDDAQDAVDINIAKREAGYDLRKTFKDTDVETLSTSDDMATNVKESHSNKTKTISKNDKHEDCDDVKTIYENLFPGDEDTKDAEVVKTVILATGSQLQPRENHDSHSAQTNTENRLVNNAIETNSLPNLQDDLLYALATSTPYKPLTVNVQETQRKLRSVHDTAQNETSQKLASVGEVTEASSITSSNTSTVDQSLSVQESEGPVRIIIKRRAAKRR